MKNIFKRAGTQSLKLCAIAMIAVIGLSCAACGGGAGDPSGGEDYVITFGLTKLSNTKFQIEIDGASWKPGAFSNHGWLVKLDGIEFFKNPGGGQGVINAAADKYADDYFDQETKDGSRDPRVMNLDSQFVGVNGKLTLSLDNPISDPVDAIGTRPNLDLYTYRINPAKASITFTYP